MKARHLLAVATRRILGCSWASLPVVLSLSVFAVLAFGVSIAAAAAPETPETGAAEPSSSTSVNLVGLLDPGQGGSGLEPLTYEFLYKESATECAGGAATPEGTSRGEGGELVTAPISGLNPGTKYTFCLRARNGASEASVSAPRTFTTPTPPETPEVTSVESVTATSATFNGVLNPANEGEAGTYVFRYETSATECGGGQNQTATETSSGTQGQLATAAVTGLAPHTTYTICLVASSAVGEEAVSAPVTFTTLTAAPVISSTSASSIGSTSATVSADINPGGLSTQYLVEYLTRAQLETTGWTAASGFPFPAPEMPAVRSSQPVFEVLTGLQPETEYVFRYRAENTRSAIIGEEAGFATTGLAPSALPDGREYELVSTSGDFGEPYKPNGVEYGRVLLYSEYPFQAAADGEAVTYVGETGETGGTGNQGAGFGNQWLANRTSSGWETNVITPFVKPRAEAVSVPSYQSFTNDLSSGFVVAGGPGLEPLASDAPAACTVLYSRDDTTGAYTSIVNETQTPENCGHPLFAGAATGGGKVIFQSEAALTSGAREATEVPPGHPNGHNGAVGLEANSPCSFGCNLYEAVSGHLRLVNVLPGESEITVPNANFGGFVNFLEAKPDFDGAISADGTDIFWTDTEAGPEFEHIYDLHGTHEIQVSGAGSANFWAATPDGRYAIYTEGGALWRFDTITSTRVELAGTGISGEAPAVEGVIGMNEVGTADASYVYFVAGNRLAPGVNEHQESATVGQPNLYLLHEGHITYIATLSPEDGGGFAATRGPSEPHGDWAPNLGARTARPTPDGTHLVFQSSQSLTAYNNISPGSGIPLPEVFVYDSLDGQLSCASCEPDGAPPSIPGERSTKLPISMGVRTVMKRWISAEGDRVFFNSLQPLTSADRNGTTDVYEWEAEGAGTCPVRPVPRQNHGCVYLLSGGNGGEVSLFVEADEEGNNVFFEHRGPLGESGTPLDQGELYDARVGGGFRPALTGCVGPDCEVPGSAGNAIEGIASSTLEGPGNLPKPKKKHKSSRHHKKKHHEKHHHKEKKKRTASATRGGTR